MSSPVGARLLHVSIPQYVFSESDSNPYRYDATPQVSLRPIADVLDALMYHEFDGVGILVRGVQSARQSQTRHQLVEHIKQCGTDRYEMQDAGMQKVEDVSADMFAAEYLPWTRQSSLLALFEGFHVYKPKCDEVPQTPIDIVMVYNADAYDQVEYVNSRHGGIGRDAYMLKSGYMRRETLLAIILINDTKYI